MSALAHRAILGMRVDDPGQEGTVSRIMDLAHKREQAYVCMANVHMAMEAHDDASYRNVVNGAAIVAPDGMPLVWALRVLGRRAASRVRGPDLMLALLDQCAETGTPIGFYGGTTETLARLVRRIQGRHPSLSIAYSHAPPFRPAGVREDAKVIHQIRSSGARILFVGLGCPKQEWWMADHNDAAGGVMVGVGAAFDLHAGIIAGAPPWMQAAGLEWLFRLSREPRRLWRRYAYNNPRFVWFFSTELLRTWRRRVTDPS